LNNEIVINNHKDNSLFNLSIIYNIGKITHLNKFFLQKINFCNQNKTGKADTLDADRAYLLYKFVLLCSVFKF
jgi:hypothetical protein